MSGSEVRRLNKGDCVLIHTVVQVRENPIRPDVPDVVIRVSRMKNPLFCSAHELRRGEKVR